MLDTLTHENFRDFTARYRGTYGWLIDENKAKTFVYISNVTEDEVTFTTMEGGRYYAYVDKEVMFEFLPVQRGWFNGKSGNKYFLTRRPARQWHRGICSANTTISMYNDVIRKVMAVDFHNSVMGDIFNKNSNMNQYSLGNNSLLSKHFAVFDTNLYFYDRHVGEYKNNVIKLHEEATFLKQELMDLAKRNSYKLEIQV